MGVIAPTHLGRIQPAQRSAEVAKKVFSVNDSSSVQMLRMRLQSLHVCVHVTIYVHMHANR